MTRINWLSIEEAEAAAPAVRRQTKRDAIVPADLSIFLHQMSLVHHHSFGPSTPDLTTTWYGRLEGVHLSIEANEDNASLTVSFYAPGPDQLKGWRLLGLLAHLPEPVNYLRTTYIQGTGETVTHGVYRPEPKGKPDQIYLTDAIADASALLQMLRRDPWNNGCFIEEVAGHSDWIVLRSDREDKIIAGRYNSKFDASNLAKRLAIEFPNQDISIQRVTRNKSEAAVVRTPEGVKGKTDE